MSERRIRFLKSHGLGNDYLVLHEGELPLEPAVLRRLCDRHRGLGSDGLLVEVPSTRAYTGLRIFNPDGSEAEKSGNGLRIFARWLWAHRGAPAEFTVEVGGGLVSCRVDPERVEVEMGEATFTPSEVPALLPGPGPQRIAGIPFPVVAVGMGNPHCVVFVDDDTFAPGGQPWRSWGPTLEHHAAFPNRTNVQFVWVKAEDTGEVPTLVARVWERGAGETESSGSSACAVAAAAVFTHRLPAPVPGGLDVAVELPGGTLEVLVRPPVLGRLPVRLRGPVEEVAWMELCAPC